MLDKLLMSLLRGKYLSAKLVTGNLPIRRFQAFQKAYPFLCTASVKNNAVKR